MWLWAPHKYSQKYAYSKGGERWDAEEEVEPTLTAGQKRTLGARDRDEDDPSAWALDDEDPGAEEGGEWSFWESTKGGSGLTEEVLRAHEAEQSMLDSPLASPAAAMVGRQDAATREMLSRALPEAGTPPVEGSASG